MFKESYIISTLIRGWYVWAAVGAFGQSTVFQATVTTGIITDYRHRELVRVQESSGNSPGTGGSRRGSHQGRAARRSRK